MSEGYCSSEDPSGRFENLDEFICDYIDGTMDVATKRAFDEYLSVNPELAAYVEDLQLARTFLQHCRCPAPRGIQRQICRRVSQEALAEDKPRHSETAHRLARFAAITSGLAVVAMFGMVVGLMFFGPDVGQPGATAPNVATPTPAQPLVGTTVPRWEPAVPAAQLAVAGPMTVPPSLYRASQIRTDSASVWRD